MEIRIGSSTFIGYTLEEADQEYSEIPDYTETEDSSSDVEF